MTKEDPGDASDLFYSQAEEIPAAAAATLQPAEETKEEPTDIVGLLLTVILS